MQKKVFAYSGEWWDSSWNNRREISITNTGFSELTNFPAYLYISKELEMRGDYNDLRFINGSCDSNGSIELDYEIEYSSASKADVWVKITTLSTGITDICMYYGNAGAVSGENKIGVWNDNYKGVWHMTEINANDSTLNNNNGTQYNGVTQINGIVDGADYFADGDSSNGDYISLENDSSLQITENLTVETWVKITGSSGEYLGIVGKATTDYNGYALVRHSSNTFRLWVGDGSLGDAHSDSTYTDSDWHYVVGVINSGTNYLYVDGVQQLDTDNSTLVDSGNKPYIGRQYYDYNSRFWQGDIDEVRISNINRSADWIKQSYEMVANQGTYVAFGEGESFSSGSSGAENIESINFGGWAYDNAFGWTSVSCNNIYGEDYKDYCGLDIEPILDINFDGNDVDFENNLVRDGYDNDPYFLGILSNFNKSDLRNGGKSKVTGAVERDSNFDNSLYFNGTSYIDFETHEELDFDGSDFTASLWFKVDEGLTENVFLFSNGSNINRRYHCWIDENYYLFCVVNNKQLESDNPISTDRWNNVSIVNEDRNFSMYLNGDSMGNINIGSATVPGSEKLILGAFGGNNNFKGELDEFRFFDVALSPAQILHNSRHNSNYLLNIDNASGDVNGWMWSSGIGWICVGNTCDGLTPESTDPTAELHWKAEGDDIYPHMITGWANAVAFNDVGEGDVGWISLQSNDVLIANYDEYNNCVSCNFREEEDELVLYLKMDEDNGSLAIDSSGFNNNAQLEGLETEFWDNDGRIDNCLDFDGSSNYLEINVDPNSELEIGLSDFSIEVWIKNENLEHSPGILPIIMAPDDTEWKLFLDENNYVKFEIFGVSVEASVNNIDEWSHVLVTADRNGNLEIYVNDTKGESKSISAQADDYIENDSIFIGKDDNGSFWDDKLDIMRLYKKVLSREDISHNYNFPERRYCSACLGQEIAGENNICYNCQRCISEGDLINCESCSSCRKYGLVFDSNTAGIKGYVWGGGVIDGELASFGWLKFSPLDNFGIYRSYLFAKYGNIYSRENIGSDYSVAPPKDYFNATYIIQTDGHITNWKSEKGWEMSLESGNLFNYNYPKLKNDYTNVLGNLDYNGLIEGLYGEVIENMPNEDETINFNVDLDNYVYFQEGDYVLEEKSSDLAYKFANSENGGAGTIIVDGDLRIEGNIEYDDMPFNGSSNELASVAWIIKGDLRIDPEVTKLAGTFIVLGKDGIECGYELDNPEPHCGAVFTCAGEESECGNRLEVSGQFLAKDFLLERTHRSLDSGFREAAEEIIYDGRNVINPPPGLGDVLKVLPTWNQIAPY